MASEQRSPNAKGPKRLKGASRLPAPALHALGEGEEPFRGFMTVHTEARTRQARVKPERAAEAAEDEDPAAAEGAHAPVWGFQGPNLTYKAHLAGYGKELDAT